MAGGERALPDPCHPTLRRPRMSGNPVQSRLAAGEAVFGGWCSSGSPFAAEVIALQGFDFVGLDGQHGLWSYESLLSSMMALARTGCGIIVRMPSRDARSEA